MEGDIQDTLIAILRDHNISSASQHGVMASKSRTYLSVILTGILQRGVKIELMLRILTLPKHSTKLYILN
jgi:hypothetical protein